ncbi:hypothetical protein Pyrfu_0595 [Pyrolobus fumarii 1A]|uniref:Uncharacterized protein n=1 Tax=Pyrolobus fumarii (strain DSM 11204 / 1A) TaxID=694429 RepID=G0EH15_PYRF1|nr:hypothetical protein [Pyrolobus fumarii]AEM38465.1 hypothetical protein Pyrfu_0595 [Pyrolobus fumarii 1A]
MESGNLAGLLERIERVLRSVEFIYANLSFIIWLPPLALTGLLFTLRVSRELASMIVPVIWFTAIPFIIWALSRLASRMALLAGDRGERRCGRANVVIIAAWVLAFILVMPLAVNVLHVLGFNPDVVSPVAYLVAISTGVAGISIAECMCSTRPYSLVALLMMIMAATAILAGASRSPWDTAVYAVALSYSTVATIYAVKAVSLLTGKEEQRK